jgi:hypothetical protein
MRPCPTIICSKVDAGQRGDEDLGLFGDIARRGAGDPDGLGKPPIAPSATS